MAEIAAFPRRSRIGMSARYTHATERGMRRAVAALDGRCGRVFVTTVFAGAGRHLIRVSVLKAREPPEMCAARV